MIADEALHMNYQRLYRTEEFGSSAVQDFIY